MSTTDAPLYPMQQLLQRPGFRQFVKFCIVGASSTLISLSIFSVLVYPLELEAVLVRWLAGWPVLRQWVADYDLHLQVAAFVGFLFAVTNGFIWNNRWTFRMHGSAGARDRYVKFVLVNVVGLVLNQIVLFIANHLLKAAQVIPEREALPAFMIATGTVVFWNFAANKYWTFKDPA